ncbi:MAG: DUF3285 domain-containing protein [Kovacikia sp.]
MEMQDLTSETPVEVSETPVEVAETRVSETSEVSETPPASPPPSYVKLAMRNMVRKRGTSLMHFALTTVGVLGLFIGLAYLTR